MQQCIKRSNILKKKSEISSLFRNGSFFRSKSFIIKFNSNDKHENRFAVLVSRKHGSAVERNRIKRVYREVIKNNFNIDSSYFDIIIRPNIGIAAEYNVIKKEILKWQQNLKKL